MFEKLIHKRLYSFLHQSDCLFTYQFGFCNYLSKSHALTSITEKIRKNLDEGKFAWGVFLDFQKAFDTVNHEILLAKNYNIMVLEVFPSTGLKATQKIAHSIQK